MLVVFFLTLMIAASEVAGYRFVAHLGKQHLGYTHLSGSLEVTWPEKIVRGIMNSPLYTPIVKVARNTMIKTAESVGIEWGKIVEGMVVSNDWDTAVQKVKNERPNLKYPDYYISRFHGYEDGNLCLDAAVEQEIAGKAVGARNFPTQGIKGETTLRNSYSQKITEMGAVIFPGDTIVDMGCGTGTSTRRLAELFKQAGSVVGIDLSPQMIAVGRFLQERRGDGFTWVENIEPDARIRFQYDCIEETGLPDGSVALVSLCLVLHELPQEATLKILREVYRILRPGGSLVIMEMDPEAPGYIKLRSNPLLFSVLRSTEPFLDEYFNLAPSLPTVLTEQIGFSDVHITAATGRHFALVATKGGILDLRPNSEERLKSDEHVATIRRQI